MLHECRLCHSSVFRFSRAWKSMRVLRLRIRGNCIISSSQTCGIRRNWSLVKLAIIRRMLSRPAMKPLLSHPLGGLEVSFGVESLLSEVIREDSDVIHKS
jgi:hypothetical protein